MEVFEEYLASIENQQHRARMEEVFDWITKRFSNLKHKIAWNQPMFTDHDTFIIGFSIAKHHMAIAPERATMIHFSDEIEKSGLDHSNELIRMRWENPVDYALLEKMITFNIMDKANCSTFWRK